MSISTTVGIVMLFGIGAAVWLSERSVRRRVLRRMKSRPARTAQEFGRDLFTTQTAETAMKVREILSRHLSVDLSRLSPEDTFVDLEMAELDSMATAEFVVDLEREFHIKISDHDAESMKTFGDVVEYVSSAARHPMA